MNNFAAEILKRKFMKPYVLLTLSLGFGTIQTLIANTSISEFIVNDEEKKNIILILKELDDIEKKNTETDKGRSLNNTQIFAELYNGVLSFSPYNIIGETFVLRIYDKEEEDVLWQKVCRYNELNNIILPNLPADTYVMTFETNEGVFATDIAL